MTVIWQPDGTLAHLGQPDWLTDDALQSLMMAFERAGFQIYAVGGCLRDTVLGRDVKDVDLSTDARPDATTAIIQSLDHWKAIPTGIDHGTVTAVAPETRATFEITTFRTDVETDGRHAVVAFSDHIEDDAKRRDFTINALYADREGNILDPVCGSADLRACRVRFIGDPEARIREDYLRILRFFRFTASHGRRDDGIDADGLAACALLADGLESLSSERIGAEMTRLISGDDIAPIVGAMEQSGVLHRILPGASVLTLARLIDLEDSFPDGTTDQRDMATRLASLGCADVGDRLRLSNAQAGKVALVVAEAGSTTPPHALGYLHGYWPAVHCLLLRWAGLLLPLDPAAFDDVRLGADAVFPVKAADLMPDYNGKALGERLRHLERAWTASRFSLSRDELRALP